MAYEYIHGSIVDDEKPERLLIDKVIDVISSCFNFPDDHVQLQIIKVLYHIFLSYSQSTHTIFI